MFSESAISVLSLNVMPMVRSTGWVASLGLPAIVCPKCIGM